RRITTTSLEIQLKLKNRYGVQRTLTLDIESRELFANAISSYEGSVLLVSHDLSFVEKCGIVDSIYLN
ncbi:hypothetical protein ABTJ32_18950, partial [Acinetobacter baumannii]